MPNVGYQSNVHWHLALSGLYHKRAVASHVRVLVSGWSIIALCRISSTSSSMVFGSKGQRPNRDNNLGDLVLGQGSGSDHVFVILSAHALYRGTLLYSSWLATVLLCTAHGTGWTESGRASSLPLSFHTRATAVGQCPSQVASHPLP
jgi:hypothetical protein